MRENILRYGVSKVKNKNSDNKNSLIFTRETLGMTVLLFCFIVTLALFSGSAIFAGFGKAICTFMYGTFGYGCFLVMAALACLGVWLVAEKKLMLSFCCFIRFPRARLNWTAATYPIATTRRGRVSLIIRSAGCSLPYSYIP